MSEKKLYKNKYRTQSLRLQNWDYGRNAAYFVTICTKNCQHYFGEIENKKMILSNIGIPAQKYWYEIPKHFPFVKLDAFVVMPNHIHGIIVIDKPVNNDGGNNGIGGDDGIDVETQNFASLPTPTPATTSTQPSLFQKNKFGPQSQNLASIVRGYKIGVTKHSKQLGIEFQWQPRFYEHIVRNNEDMKRIQNYINNNVKNWKEDGFYNNHNKRKD